MNVPASIGAMRRVSDVGEFGLIDRIARLAGRTASPDVVLGIGDDAAVLRLRRGQEVVATNDAFVEGVHFRFDQETPRTAGRRAAVGCLSDLAAMGARPLGLLLALAVPARLPLATALGFVRGILFEARRQRTPLVGGNVTRASEVSATLTALGAVPRGSALRRDRGRAGDRVFVTGVLGRSAFERARGRVAHVGAPRIAAGRRLARVRGVGACIDISDGLVADLGHVCRASRVAARIDPARVPRPAGLAAACRARGLAAERLVLAGGEDYELLFSVRPGGPGAAELARRLSLPVTEIGRLEAGPARVHGVPAGVLGWRHF
jgi:thiamine-monophosphate kinase